MQIARGAVGICCAKLGEAEVFAAAGIDDIRLPYPLNPANADRVLSSLDRTRLSFIVDDIDVARSWSGLMRVNQREVDVLVKVDVGFHRCGIDPESRGAAELVASRCRAARAAVPRAPEPCGTCLRRRIRRARSPPLRRAKPRRSHGSRPTWSTRAAGRGDQRRRHADRAVQPAAAGRHRARPGNYIYFDRTQVALGAATWDDCALTVLARVVSRPARGSPHPRLRQQDADDRQARGFAACPGFGVVFANLDTPRAR